MTAILQQVELIEGKCILRALSDKRTSIGDFIGTSDTTVKSFVFGNFILSGSGSNNTFNNALAILKKYPIVPQDIVMLYAYLERIHHLLFRILEENSSGQLHIACAHGIFTVHNGGVSLESKKIMVAGSCFDKLEILLANRTGTILDTFKAAIRMDACCSDNDITEVSLEVDVDLTPNDDTCHLIHASPLLKAVGHRS